jgi:hypothetical protein
LARGFNTSPGSCSSRQLSNFLECRGEFSAVREKIQHLSKSPYDGQLQELRRTFSAVSTKGCRYLTKPLRRATSQGFTGVSQLPRVSQGFDNFPGVLGDLTTSQGLPGNLHTLARDSKGLPQLPMLFSRGSTSSLFHVQGFPGLSTGLTSQRSSSQGRPK